MTGLSARIADHIVAASFADLPKPAVAATVRSLVDAYGVMLAASGIGEGCSAFAELAVASGAGPARLIGRAERVGVAAAALANGALAHAIDFEDAYDGAPVHPNAVQIPAALALAQALGGVSGEDLVTALAVGCDLTCRLGLALDEDIGKFGFYPPPLLGAYGAVAACARLAKLDAGQILDALSLLLCSHHCSAELKYSPESTVRAVRDGFAAQAAVQAVLLAARGVRGFDAPLEGKAGFFASYARGVYRTEPILDGLGTVFLGEQVSFKPWPCCRGTHAAVEAVLDIANGSPLDPAGIGAIEVSGAPLLTMLYEPEPQKRRPSTAIDAKFSLPFTIGVAAVHGTVLLDHFDDAGLRDPAVLAVADKVRFTADPAITDPTAAVLTVAWRGGEVQRREILHPRGHPANPISDDALDAKFGLCAQLAASRPSDAQIDAQLQQLRGVASLSDVAILPDL